MNESSFSTESNKRQEALQIAKQLFLQGPDWVTFFREVLGIGGVARRLFPTKEEFLSFEQSEEFSEIQNMVAALRNKKGSHADAHEPTRVITVRLPKSLHEALRAEAHDHKTSMNKLCIAKLLQVLEEENEVEIPAPRGGEAVGMPVRDNGTRPGSLSLSNGQDSTTTPTTSAAANGSGFQKFQG